MESNRSALTTVLFLDGFSPYSHIPILVCPNGPFTIACLALPTSALAALLFGWLPGAVHTLILVMTVDMVLGAVSARIRKQFDRDRLVAGMVRKCGILLIVWVAYVAEARMGDVHLALPVVGWFVATEGASVLRNLRLLGVPVPSVLETFFEGLEKRGRKG